MTMQWLMFLLTSFSCYQNTHSDRMIAGFVGLQQAEANFFYSSPLLQSE